MDRPALVETADVVGQDNATVPLRSFAPAKAIRCLLLGRADVLTPSHEPIAGGVIRHGSQLGRPDVTVDAAPLTAGIGVGVQQPVDAAVVRLEEIAVSIEL